MRNKRILLVVTLLVVALALLLAYSTMNLAKYKAEVCVEFNGRTQCRTASAVSEEDTVRAASNVACATLANGVTEVMACEHNSPATVRWIKRP